MILNIYPYGSKVYGTADEKSDTDLIMVSDFSHEQETQALWPGIDLTIWTAAKYQRLLNEHDPSALECWFLPYEMAIRSREFEFKLDLGKLRRSFSAKSSNSWVKAKKKIEVHGEWRLGLKSLFHSLRIMEFGLQIAMGGRIRDYAAANDFWKTIIEQRDGRADWRQFTSWADFKEYWQPHHNRLQSDFRLAAPLPEGEDR
jgi:predicted nucleotidyltransferase